VAKDEPWLTKPTNSFEEAFPNVAAIDFEIDPDPYKQFGKASVRITRASLRSFVSCPNERCRRGGFDFGQFLMDYTYSGEGVLEVDQIFPCNGDEGTPAGRRKGSPCMGSFHVKGSITFK
jgi:hypothetical protein